MTSEVLNVSKEADFRQEVLLGAKAAEYGFPQIFAKGEVDSYTLFKAANEGEAVRTEREKVLEVIGIAFTPAEVTEEDGQKTKVTKTSFILKDGKIFFSVSPLICQSAANLLLCFGHPRDWKEPLNLFFTKEETAGGKRTMNKLSVLTPTQAKILAKKN